MGFPSQQVYDAYLNPAVDVSNEAFSWGKPDLHGLRLYPFCKPVCVFVRRFSTVVLQLTTSKPSFHFINLFISAMFCKVQFSVRLLLYLNLFFLTLSTFASEKLGWSSAKTDEVLLPVLKRLNSSEVNFVKSRKVNQLCTQGE